jgi:toxin ParE1/3/4
LPGCASEPGSARPVSKFTLSREAIGDLELIWEHIAEDSPVAADSVIEAAYRLCSILGQHPELGRVRRFSENSLVGIRSFVITDFPNYVIFYRPVSAGVQIVRVLHGARDIDALFGQ